MSIDWFTVIAQMINFLILVALLKRFLFSKIVAAMEQRETTIRNQLQEIDSEKQKLQQQITVYEQKNQLFEQEHKQRLEKTNQEVETYRAELVAQVREETQQMKQKWNEGISRQKQAFLQQLQRYIAEETSAIARQALLDLASVNIENSIIDFFVERLHDLKITEDSRECNIHSSFPLEPEIQKKIIGILKHKVHPEIVVDFHVSHEIICGIEAKFTTFKISWCIQDYLAQLEQQMAKILDLELGRG